MKNSTPISLFSFQDVITSLTGIMIVVVLVILLQLVETTRISAEAAKTQPEYLALKKIYEELLIKRENLKKKIVASAEAADKYAEYSIEKINELIHEEEAYSTITQKKIAQAERALSALTLQNEKDKLTIARLQQQLREISKNENEIKELQAILIALQEKRKNISEQIKRKTRMLRFEFAGYDSQTPLLIECNAWGFRCKRYPDGEIITFGTRGKSSLPKHLSQLQNWLKENDVQDTYPVLLFREDALRFYENISLTLFTVYQKRNWGQELVSRHEEIF